MPRGATPAVAVMLMAIACGGSKPSTPTPPTTPGETITGRERIGWDQPSPSAQDLAALRYAIYVDNVRSEIADVSCTPTAGAAGFPCSGRLPPMSNGAHVLELAAFVDSGGIVESARSQPLRVTVTGLGGGVDGTLTNGDVITTADGVRLQVEVLFEGLTAPAALAVARDGRVFVGDAPGVLMLRQGEALGPAQLTDGPALALDLSPNFARDGFVFVTQVVAEASGQSVFRTSRVRDMGGWLADRMVILQHGPASLEPAAALRFGPDGKLHLAFDDGGSADAAERMSEWSGKLLRMEADGRTPHDQAAASPVLWRGLTSPRGFDWGPDGSALWLADASRDGVERLRVLSRASDAPRRAAQHASYVLPRGAGAAGIAFYQSRAIREFGGDLFVAARDGGYILRIRFDPTHRSRPSMTERLLEDVSIRAIAVGPDGSIYFCTPTTLARLVRSN